MPPTRILIVDDSVVVRKLLSDQLGAASGLEVMGTAANGRIALQKLERDRPDVVVLDVEMPVMGGLETLREIKRIDRSIRVIMFSSFTTAGAQVTVDALAMGAEDYVAKPSDMLRPGEAVDTVQRELVAKIKMLAPSPPKPRKPSTPAPPVERVRAQACLGTVDVLAIGSSTGGPNALAELFARFPANLPVPIVIVQHMPAVFTKHFAERLSRESALAVDEAEEGARLRPGQAYVARGGLHLRVVQKGPDRVLALDESPPVQSCRPSVDVLFDSVAELYGGRALAVVLTGMGEDGLQGARALHAAGSRILVQDEESSVVWGMAGAVSRAGIADAALPILDLADEIVRRTAVGRR
jgi:two-component system chemotaxis response regulator CheB